VKGRTRLEKRRKNGLTVEGEGAAAADGVWRRQGLEDVVQGEKTQAESWRTKGGRAAAVEQRCCRRSTACCTPASEERVCSGGGCCGRTKRDGGGAQLSGRLLYEPNEWF